MKIRSTSFPAFGESWSPPSEHGQKNTPMGSSVHVGEKKDQQEFFIYKMEKGQQKQGLY